jgi:structural maintenance of chromosome 4
VLNDSHRLYDLIHINDHKFKDAFYFALKDTLVCESLDIATRIAYGQERHRVITLKGELIEKSGTMSGGGRPRTGGMSSVKVLDFSDDQVRELEKEVETMMVQIMRLKDERPAIESTKNQNIKRY